MTFDGIFERRTLLKATAAVGSLLPFSSMAAAAAASPAPDKAGDLITTSAVRMVDVPLAPTTKVTVERRGQIVLIGINRPDVQNRIDPETYLGLARAYYRYDHDPSLRAAVLFGHGDNFSRGIDVVGFRPLITAGKPFLSDDEAIDPLAIAKAPRSKPLIAVVHGDTWNMAHEFHLAADIRIAAADTRFGQDENTHGRFPGGGSTVRFVREAGWGNAMRYMLTGDHWSAEEAYRMGVVQEVAATQELALEVGIRIANKIAACAPLGIKTTLTSAHLATAQSDANALPLLQAQFGALFKTDDFKEGIKADAEGRPPIFQGR
jgi:enoyl-CoA hydratase/carnithine racemase